MTPIKNGSLLASVLVSSQAWPLPGKGMFTFQNIGGGQVAYVAFGNSNGVVTAAPTAQAVNGVVANSQVMGGFPVLANAPLVPINAPSDATHFAAIGTANLSLVVSAVSPP